jgi:hypothetical protein
MDWPIFSRLDKFKALGNGKYVACCPAHQDKTPSLAIEDKGDRLVLHCFAGCGTDDILTATGLTWNDLFTDNWEAAKHRAFAEAQINPKVNRRDHALSVVQIAMEDIHKGRALTIEDRAAVKRALGVLDG